MVAGVQIESHTPLCSYEGKRKSLVNPSLTTGVFSQPCLCMTFDSSKVTLDLNEHACMKHNQIFTVRICCEAGNSSQLRHGSICRSIG